MFKPNSKIFCNTPWYDLHIYWDGSFGMCCQESHKLYAETNKDYNISRMSIIDWYNSQPVRDFRSRIMTDQPLSECSRCYLEEQNEGNSRRLKSNAKSVIFTRTNFHESLMQSPGYKHFEFSACHDGTTQTMPIDLHIDLGNYCNLACKMCRPSASSTIASQQVRWGIESSREFLGTDWTRDTDTWNSFKQQLLEIPNLNNIHFMGGETLLTQKFNDLVDHMIAHERFDLCFSFVTNGTVFRSELIEKLKLFRRVGIEVSIETVDAHNAYQRQGTNTDLVLNNIQKFLNHCNGSSVTVALRPALSALTIGYYVGLLQFALDNQLIVKSNLCYNPRFLYAEILPKEIKEHYKTSYNNFLSGLQDVSSMDDYNASDPNNYRKVIKQQAVMCLNLLCSDTPADSEQQLEAMVRHCERWDRVYGHDARLLYPEFVPILDRYSYDLSS